MPPFILTSTVCDNHVLIVMVSTFFTTLQEAHLTQLQSLLPDVITLETVNLPVTQRSTRTEANLLVTLTTTEGPAALRAELHVKLARHLLHSYTAFLRETAAEARKAGDAEKAAEMEQEAALTGPVTEFRAPYPDAVPDYKVAAPKVASPLPADTTAHATASGSQGATSSEDATAPLKATSGAVAGTVRPTAAPGGVTLASGAGPRRLSFTGLDASEEASLLEVMPEGLRSRSKDGVISMASLKKLEGNEREFMRWSSKAAQDDRGVRAALGALPATYSRLRRIFGPRGPSALKLDAVVDKIRGGGAETTSKEEVVAQLQTLAERAPEFVELKAWGPCGTPAVWINRRCDLNALAGKLKAAAQTRLSGVAGAEAGVVVKV